MICKLIIELRRLNQLRFPPKQCSESNNPFRDSLTITCKGGSKMFKYDRVGVGGGGAVTAAYITSSESLIYGRLGSMARLSLLRAMEALDNLSCYLSPNLEHSVIKRDIKKKIDLVFFFGGGGRGAPVAPPHMDPPLTYSDSFIFPCLWR